MKWSSSLEMSNWRRFSLIALTQGKCGTKGSDIYSNKLCLCFLRVLEVIIRRAVTFMMYVLEQNSLVQKFYIVTHCDDMTKPNKVGPLVAAPEPTIEGDNLGLATGLHHPTIPSRSSPVLTIFS